MRITIGCVDGVTYNSDHYPDEQCNDEIANGLNFTGDWKKSQPVDIKDVHDYGKVLADVALGKSIGDYNPTELSFRIHGVERHFNPKHIVWIAITYDDE